MWNDDIIAGLGSTEKFYTPLEKIVLSNENIKQYLKMMAKHTYSALDVERTKAFDSWSCFKIKLYPKMGSNLVGQFLLVFGMPRKGIDPNYIKDEDFLLTVDKDGSRQKFDAIN